MVNRVTEEELRAYTPILPSVDVLQFLDDAHILMDVKVGEVPSFGEPLAKLIEKNLAAHLYTVAQEYGGLTGQKTGESSETYANAAKTAGMGSTRFGQVVLSLDPSGEFSEISKRKAQFRVL